jgi:hypothetical protein
VDGAALRMETIFEGAETGREFFVRLSQRRLRIDAKFA